MKTLEAPTRTASRRGVVKGGLATGFVFAFHLPLRAANNFHGPLLDRCLIVILAHLPLSFIEREVTLEGRAPGRMLRFAASVDDAELVGLDANQTLDGDKRCAGR